MTTAKIRQQIWLVNLYDIWKKTAYYAHVIFKAFGDLKRKSLFSIRHIHKALDKYYFE